MTLSILDPVVWANAWDSENLGITDAELPLSEALRQAESIHKILLGQSNTTQNQSNPLVSALLQNIWQMSLNAWKAWKNNPDLSACIARKIREGLDRVARSRDDSYLDGTLTARAAKLRRWNRDPKPTYFGHSSVIQAIYDYYDGHLYTSREYDWNTIFDPKWFWKSLDRSFLDHDAAKAVYNRRLLLEEHIRKLRTQKWWSDLHVVSVACWTMDEVYRILDDNTSRWDHRLRVTGIDLDAWTVRVAQKRFEKHWDTVHVVQWNVLNGLGTILSQSKWNWEWITPLSANTDLIMSAGLIDYFSDDKVVILLREMREMLVLGWTMIVWNFIEWMREDSLPINTSRPYMEVVLGWMLIHRTPEDLRRLAGHAWWHSNEIQIIYEELWINAFIKWKKLHRNSAI